mmetsp:Transcript_89881/g.288172  ORF Transcript_89881/g.288172 Transcript_89881/m.288172 type:complete len:273 (+) Transcript_89881:1490-2308(+)
MDNGPQPPCMHRSWFTPMLHKKCTTSARPSWAAASSGPAPSWVTLSKSALVLVKYRMMPRCPQCAATKAGVAPACEALFMSAPARHKNLTTSRWPFLEATYMGVRPPGPEWSMSALARKNCSATSLQPSRAASSSRSPSPLPGQCGNSTSVKLRGCCKDVRVHPSSKHKGPSRNSCLKKGKRRVLWMHRLILSTVLVADKVRLTMESPASLVMSTTYSKGASTIDLRKQTALGGQYAAGTRQSFTSAGQSAAAESRTVPHLTPLEPARQSPR